MRILHLTLAAAGLAWLLPCSRAQDAVLVLSPSPVTSVRAGTGSAGFRGDGAAAVAAQMASPSAMAQDAPGNLFIADTRNHRVRRIAPDGTITTVAGTGAQGFAGDEGPAKQAQLDSPAGIAVSTDGTLYIADTHNHRVRRVDTAGVIHTVAGTGTAGFLGDGAPATGAQLSSPTGLAPGLAGDLYIADSGNHRIRHVSATGIIATVAGDGAQGISPDGTLAITAHLDTPAAVSVRSDGSVLLADRGNNRILVLGSDGILRSLNTASMALRKPSSVASNSFGDTLIADTGNYRIAEISSSGAASVLGSGVQGTLDTAAAPARTVIGAPAAILDTGSSSGAQFAALDRDHSQLFQVTLPELTFPDTVLATASTPRTLLLRNAGGTPLSVSSLSLPASFSRAATSSCGATPFSIAAGASCSLDLLFTPQTDGALSGTLEVDPQHAPPQRVILSGTGLRTGTQLTSSTALQTSGGISYAGSPMTLTAAVLGGSATAATGTVTFLDGASQLGTGTLNLSAQATFTTGSLPAGSHTLVARYNGDVRYQPSTSSSVAITVATPPDFTMAAPAGNRVVLQSGSAGALSLVLQPVSGVLNRTVAVTLDGLPNGSVINVTPVPVLLSSDPVTVSIAFKMPVNVSRREPSGIWFASLLPLLLLLPRSRRAPALFLAALTFLPLLQGCGGGYLSGKSVTAQSAGSTYAVTVTATCPGVTGATIAHSTTFTVVVQ